MAAPKGARLSPLIHVNAAGLRMCQACRVQPVDAIRRKASAMNTVRAVHFGILALLMATTAYAQKPGVGPAATTASFLGESVTIGPRRFPTPQFVICGLPVGIWARVPPPYDVAANRSAAENPLP